jgi:RNA polymerase-binding transcription factor DksA
MTTSTSTSTDFLASQRTELLARRDSYLADVARSTATALELTEDGANQDMADEDGFGEGDTLNVERDRLLVVASEARARVAEIDAALGRVDANTYGLCESCGKPIPHARLEVVPEATLCVSCKAGASLRRR